MKIGPNTTYNSSTDSDADSDSGMDDSSDYYQYDEDNEGSYDHDYDYDEYIYNYTMPKDSISLFGEDYSFRITTQKDFEGNNIITSEMKFDKYFLFGIDNMGGQANNTPPCGPNIEYDSCKDSVNSDETCCTHITFWDQDKEDQYSFYRCMNQKVVDASFSVEIDGVKMSMSCSGMESSATSLKYARSFLFAIFSIFVLIIQA